MELYSRPRRLGVGGAQQECDDRRALSFFACTDSEVGRGNQAHGLEPCGSIYHTVPVRTFLEDCSLSCKATR